MVNTAMMANYSCFANHNAYAMVNGEVLANGSSGIDIHAGCFMSVFRYYSGWYFCVQFIEHIGNSIGHYGIVGSIGNNYFGVVKTGWIAMID